MANDLTNVINAHEKVERLKAQMNDAGLETTLLALELYLDTIAYHEASLTRLGYDKQMTPEAKAMAISRIL